MIWEQHIPEDVISLYEVHDFKHAAAILAVEFPAEFSEICSCLLEFRFTEADVRRPGGSESAIPKRFSEILHPLGWQEMSLTGTMVVEGREIRHDTHKVDYIKNRVAFDLEWNSKDQTFDRDLYAFRHFFEYNKISVGVLVTRSNELDPWFSSLGTVTDRHGVVREIRAKYGASTTQMGKLLPRLQSGRNGGCPVLVFGITPRLLVPPNDVEDTRHGFTSG